MISGSLFLDCQEARFVKAQFHIRGFGELYRFDRNRKGNRILLYICNDIPSKLIESNMTKEGFLLEINLQKKNGFYTARITKKSL